MLKQNDTIEYTAQGYANAETVGTVDGCTVFVPYMIAGESALVKVNYAKRGVAYADVVKITRSSPLRVAPKCALFGKCGGCSLMHMDYAEQLAFKRNKVAQNLRKIGKLDCDVLPCFPSPKTLGYRNKLSLPVRGKRGHTVIGMYRKGTHDAVAAEGCLLCENWATTLVNTVRDYLDKQGIEPYNERNFTGVVRHLVARYIDGQLLVVIVSNGAFCGDLAPLRDELSKHFDKFGLFVNVNTYKNNVILGKETHHICGLKCIESEHLGVKFRLQPESFFQVNDGVKDALYRKVRELLDLSKTEVLIDCFSGIGVLTNVLANDRFATYAIELEGSAVADANDITRLNGKRITNVCGDANVELPRLITQNANKRATLVVDPPRKGLGQTICDTILNAEIDNVVYVSCDSATLARDLAILSQGYAIAYVQPFDMFPNTDQVETVVHLVRTVRKNND